MAVERYNLGKTVENYDYKKKKDKFSFEQETWTTRTDSGKSEFLPDNVDALKDLSNVPYAQLYSSDGIVTPMEYYGNLVDVTDSKLQLKSKNSSSDIPVYFWVETLKNWCTYTYNKINDYYGIATLNVWNGQNNWDQLDKIIQEQNANQLTKRQVYDFVNEYDGHNYKEELERYTKILIANSTKYRFPYESLHTSYVCRVYKPYKTPDYDISSSGFFSVIGNVFKSMARFAKNFGMFIVDYSIPALIYNTATKGVSEAFSAGANRWVSAMTDLVGAFQNLIAPVFDFLSTDEASSRTLSKMLEDVNAKENAVAAAIYLYVPYDTGYFSNDQDTFQTIRFRNTWGTDGKTHTRQTTLSPVFQVPNPICSPLVVRSSTGELTLAVTMTYTGPIAYYIDSDYKKKVGLSEEDVQHTNEVLAKMFGDGSDKTAADFLNIRGNLLSDSDITISNTSLQSKLASDKIEQMNSANDAGGVLVISATRSKTSSTVESPTINTVTKW